MSAAASERADPGRAPARSRGGAGPRGGVEFRAIRTGIWYGDFPTRGQRAATIEVLSARGVVLERRRVTATSHWRRRHYEPRCGRHYRVRYTTVADISSFRVWVRRP